MFKDELGLEMELEQIMGILAETDLEAEAEIPNSANVSVATLTPTTRQPSTAMPVTRAPVSAANLVPQWALPPTLAWRLPKDEYSDEKFKFIEKMLDVFHAVHTTFELFGPELTGLGGALFAITGPILEFILFWLQFGGAYQDAQVDIARTAMKSGFSRGVVTGADFRRWAYVTQLFWQTKADYRVDAYAGQGAGNLQQQAYNAALKAGFVQGRQITKDLQQMNFFWKSLAAALSPGERAEFSGDSKSWPSNKWSNWYVTAAAKFQLRYLAD